MIILYLTVAFKVINASITAWSDISGMLTGSTSQKKVNFGGTLRRDEVVVPWEATTDWMTAENKTAQISTCVAFIL